MHACMRAIAEVCFRAKACREERLCMAAASDDAVSEARKKVLRALDAKVSQQEDSVALAAIETALKLANNIVEHPSEPKYRRFRSNNPGISRKLLHVPGGPDLLLALGFRTTVHEFEEVWVVEDEPNLSRSLGEATIVLEHYLDLTRKKIERAAHLRREKMANESEVRKATLQQIEEDKRDRKDKNWNFGNSPAQEGQRQPADQGGGGAAAEIEDGSA